MTKYRIFSLVSLEYVIERDVTFYVYDLFEKRETETRSEDFISLLHPKTSHFIARVGEPKLKIFLTYKKAQKWVTERCEKYKDAGVTPDQFHIESINTKV